MYVPYFHQTGTFPPGGERKLLRHRKLGRVIPFTSPSPHRLYNESQLPWKEEPDGAACKVGRMQLWEVTPMLGGETVLLSHLGSPK